MAATGAIVGGAAAITSSTAFADRGTPGSLPTTSGTVSFEAANRVQDKDRKDLSINVTNYTSSCPDTTPVTRQISINGGSFMALTTNSVGYTVAPGENNTAGVNYTFTIRSVCGGAYTCDTFTVTMRTQPGGGNAGEVSLNGGAYFSGSNIAPAGPISSTGTSAACDVNPPPVP